MIVSGSFFFLTPPPLPPPPGPLLYHYENMANELSVELSYEDIRTAMVKFGFHLEVKTPTTGANT